MRPLFRTLRKRLAPKPAAPAGQAGNARGAGPGIPAARRLLLVALLCALAPASAVALYAAYSLASLRMEHSRTRLAEATQLYTAALTDRLSLAQQSLEDLYPSLTPGAVLTAQARTTLAERFVSISVLDKQGQHWSLLGEHLHRPALEPQTVQRLASGAYYLHAYGAEGQQKRVLLLRALDADRLLAAELAPAYLWGNMDELSAGIDYCAVAATGDRLFCSRHLPLTSLQVALPDTSAERTAPFTRQRERKALPAHYATVSLDRLGGGDWVVLARERAGADFVPVGGFLLAFAAIMLLALGAMGTLTLVQTRRALAPAAGLAEDVRRLDAEGSGARVRVPPEPDLVPVAQTLNRMSAHLEEQGATIAALGELDRSVLAHASLSEIVRLMFEQIPRVAAADTASITVFDPAPDVQSHSFLRDYHDGQPAAVRVDAVERQTVGKALAGCGERWLHKGRLLEIGLDVLLPTLARHFLLLPVFREGELRALLTLGYREREELAVGERTLPRHLADRLGVAAELTRQAASLARCARVDPLTQLPNRASLEASLEHEVVRAKRSRQRLAVAALSLGQLRDINSTLGYAAGDEILRAAARRVLGCLRKTDSVARVGGAEFIALLPDLTNDRQAMQLATQMLGALAGGVRVGEHERHLTASIGIGMYPTDTTVPELLLRHASTALARAEQAGSNRIVFFEEHMSLEASRRATLERELRSAIDAGEFLLHYQPQIDVAARSVGAAAALLRWKHPVADVVLPEQFLPVAEATGLIVPIGALALRLACRQLAAWDRGGPRIERLALDVAARQLEHGDFPAIVEETLREFGLAPQRLELAFGETLLGAEQQTRTDALVRLGRLGVRMILTEFGTGNSSLAYLTKVPVEAFKLGRQFVGALDSDPGAVALVRSMIEMGHSLGKQVIAEGVDSPTQLAQLQRFGCDWIIGACFSRPVDAAGFANFVQSFSAHPWARAA